MDILITGGAGFVGSNIALKLKENYPHYNIIALDNLKRRGSEVNIPRLQAKEVRFVHGDIRNKEDLYLNESIDLIIDSSAEPSVLAGITTPVSQVINNNLHGTVNCLELAQQHNAGFIFLSTSRVYPIAKLEKANYIEDKTRFKWTDEQEIEGISSNGVTEKFPLIGSRSFYGSTKLASELIINEYEALTGMKTVINRCGVLTGPWQMGKVDQGVIVLWLARHMFKGTLGYFGYGGTGKQVRDILHIDDFYRLIDWQIHNIDKVSGEIFNVGGGKNISVSLKELTLLCQHVTGNKINIKGIKEDRQADIRVYITDNSYVSQKTNWFPTMTAAAILDDIYTWIKDNETVLKKILTA